MKFVPPTVTVREEEREGVVPRAQLQCRRNRGSFLDAPLCLRGVRFFCPPTTHREGEMEREEGVAKPLPTSMGYQNIFQPQALLLRDRLLERQGWTRRASRSCFTLQRCLWMHSISVSAERDDRAHRISNRASARMLNTRMLNRIWGCKARWPKSKSRGEAHWISFFNHNLSSESSPHALSYRKC